MITQARWAGRRILQMLCFVGVGIALGTGLGFHGRGKKWAWVAIDIILAVLLLAVVAWLIWAEEGPHL